MSLLSGYLKLPHSLFHMLLLIDAVVVVVCRVIGYSVCTPICYLHPLDGIERFPCLMWVYWLYNEDIP